MLQRMKGHKSLRVMPTPIDGHRSSPSQTVQKQQD